MSRLYSNPAYKLNKQLNKFNLYAEYIMWNAGLDEAQAGSRLPGEISITSDMLNITLMAESEEEL